MRMARTRTLGYIDQQDFNWHFHASQSNTNYQALRFYFAGSLAFNHIMRPSTKPEIWTCLNSGAFKPSTISLVPRPTVCGGIFCPGPTMLLSLLSKECSGDWNQWCLYVQRRNDFSISSKSLQAHAPASYNDGEVVVASKPKVELS